MKTMIPEMTQENIDSWLKGDYDEATKREIVRLQKENPEELLDAFYTHLSFGTGGLRGVMGVGTNRMNEYTVRAATQGLANYLLQQKEKPSVLIGYDSRHNSLLFAEQTADVLAANGIKVYLFNEIRPVPIVSFGVQHLSCTAGVMITASHNPPRYNGYKVYWSHGGQVLPPHDVGIIAEVEKIKDPKQVKRLSGQSPLINHLADEIDQAYLKTVKGLALHEGENHSRGKELKVIYTPLHGTGLTMVPKILKDWGFTNAARVEAQTTFDGAFPTVKTPNPEDPAALALGVDLLEKSNGDLLLGTDPDCDRIAAVVMHKGKPFYFNGNQTACLALEHICRALKERHVFPPKAICVKTIVTTELFKAIADHYGVLSLDVLTGFKYIGEKIAEWEEDKKGGVTPHHFIFGAEESYGYLVGTHARDKDAVIMAALLSEAALHLKLQGKSFVDLLYEIYHTYGIYREALATHAYEGMEGVHAMGAMMDRLRENPPETIGSAAVEVFEDYLTHTRILMGSKTRETLTLPRSNVLRFWLSDHTKIVVRPSGTEPTIKTYIGCYEKHFFESAREIEETIAHCDRRVEYYLGQMKHLLGS